MTAPNLFNITTVIGKTLAFDVTTSPVTMISNATDSNSSIRINSLFVANVGGQTATFTVNFVRTNITTRIARVVPCDVGNTVIVIGKDTSIYLEEGDTLTIQSSINSVLQAVISYDAIS
jgi:hypothetical protein